MSKQSNSPSVGLVLVDLLLRCFLLFGLLGLPLFIAEWRGWWMPPTWLQIPLAIWLFLFGMLFIVVGFAIVIGVGITAFFILDSWFSLILGCLGVHTAIAHHRETCSTVGDLIVSLGNSLKSFEISFPLDDRRRNEQSQL